VYFRTLHANGTPSTAVARPQDWRDILEICFENREADIGRFLRRHLPGADLGALLTTLGVPAAPAPPSLKERTEALLSDGERRFASAIDARRLTPEEKEILKSAAWRVALILNPSRPDAVADQVFINKISSSNPNYTGWPIWLDSRSFTDQRSAPRVIDNGFEALIISLHQWSQHLDFMRFDPSGQFFLRRELQDDRVPSRVRPGTPLDPVLAILRVAEAIAVGLAMAKALEWPKEGTLLGFAFRWSGLSGRQLEPWANPHVTIIGGTAHDDAVTTFIEVPLDTAPSAIAPFVDDATRRLFALFDGYRIPNQATEDWVRRLIERRL
jgi:hypothetical protein